MQYTKARVGVGYIKRIANSDAVPQPCQCQSAGPCCLKVVCVCVQSLILFESSGGGLAPHRTLPYTNADDIIKNPLVHVRILGSSSSSRSHDGFRRA